MLLSCHSLLAFLTIPNQCCHVYFQSAQRFEKLKLDLKLSHDGLDTNRLLTNGARKTRLWACMRSHLVQLCVWQTFGLLTTHRQDPSCSTVACQLSTQMGLWESPPSVYQSLDVTPLSQTSMPPLSLRASPQRCSIWEVDPLTWCLVPGST